MSSRSELILVLEQKFNELLNLSKKMTPDPNSDKAPTDPKLYQMLISENEKLEDEIYQLKKIIQTLPKETVNDNKKQSLILAIQSNKNNLDSLRTRYDQSQTNFERNTYSNLIGFIEEEIDHQNIILSLL